MKEGVEEIEEQEEEQEEVIEDRRRGVRDGQEGERQ